MLNSFRPERVLSRPGGVNLRSCLCGYGRTPPRNASISLPGQKIPAFQIGNNCFSSGVSVWKLNKVANKAGSKTAAGVILRQFFNTRNLIANQL
jgi:hypothetical protein